MIIVVKNTSDEGFYSSEYNYAEYEYSDAWADSYIWLPSRIATIIKSFLWKTSLTYGMNLTCLPCITPLSRE